jgi:hypothetical protein
MNKSCHRYKNFQKLSVSPQGNKAVSLSTHVFNETAEKEVQETSCRESRGVPQL